MPREADHYAYVVAVLLEDLIDLLPTGAIHKAAMDENYCLCGLIK